MRWAVDHEYYGIFIMNMVSSFTILLNDRSSVPTDKLHRFGSVTFFLQIPHGSAISSIVGLVSASNDLPAALLSRSLVAPMMCWPMVRCFFSIQPLYRRNIESPLLAIHA